MKEFNLSEKRHTSTSMFELDKDGYPEEDVKEFIRLLKEEIGEHIEGNGFYSQLIKIIDKLAGEKLK